MDRGCVKDQPQRVRPEPTTPEFRVHRFELHLLRLVLDTAAVRSPEDAPSRSAHELGRDRTLLPGLLKQ
jgi:hypothetical protein